MMGGLQGDFGDLDIKYLKKNISKCWSHISKSFKRTPRHCAKWWTLALTRSFLNSLNRFMWWFSTEKRSLNSPPRKRPEKETHYVSSPPLSQPPKSLKRPPLFFLVWCPSSRNRKRFFSWRLPFKKSLHRMHGSWKTWLTSSLAWPVVMLSHMQRFQFLTG